ncbi:hypothetical protein [Nitrosophilus alvini]|uniref:hypothetical protein n=1 Tax=Nitrosophilus alvini TaxID=2714855 RepID=UPI00190C5014|nr:hypothetical protein [Nitrosophilus alvini]
MDTVLYIHILAATAWIGGSLFLFALGIFLRDKNAQSNVYLHIGPLYGYFETFWLILLILTGTVLFIFNGLYDVLTLAPESSLGEAVKIKLLFVFAITVLTAIHMYLAFKTHGKERTLLQTVVSRSSSMLIFILNLFILWYAIQLRNFL